MIRSPLRALVLSGLAGALLAGCATGDTYRAGPGGDYYYGQPEVHYNDPYWYGWGGWGGWGPYGYWGAPYGPYWGPYWGGPYWGGGYHHYHPRPPHTPPPSHGPDPGENPPPPGGGHGHGGRNVDRGPDRLPQPHPVITGRPLPRVPAPPTPMPAPTHGPDAGDVPAPGHGGGIGDRGPDRMPAPRPVIPARPMPPVPAPRNVTPAHPVGEVTERDHHRRFTP